jgi:hypothetical protein
MQKTQFWIGNHEDWWSFWFLGWLPIIALLLLLAVTLWMKHYWLVPYLERHYKKNAAQRQKLRTRRLRDTLADPVLVRDLERRLMIQYRGNTSHVQDALDRMRQEVSNYYSSSLSSSTESHRRDIEGRHEEEENDDYSPRGEEKKEAATQILYGTFVSAIVLYVLQSFYMVFIWQQHNHIKVALQTIFLCVVHMMDSLQLYRRQHKTSAAKRTTA